MPQVVVHTLTQPSCMTGMHLLLPPEPLMRAVTRLDVVARVVVDAFLEPRAMRSGERADVY